MLLMYRLKRLLYLSWYMSFQGNISAHKMNSFLASSRVSISVLGVGKSNLQSTVFACTISAVTLTYAWGTGLPCHRHSGYTMPEATSILNAPLATGTNNLQQVGPVIESTGNFPKGSS